ncbi:hypothetical protein JCM8097_009281 [Rhodosporidiobolus ruineniae]
MPPEADPPLPSLYTSLPTPPSISSHFDPVRPSAPERDSLLRLSQLATRGASALFLDTLLEDEQAQHVKRRRAVQSGRRRRGETEPEDEEDDNDDEDEAGGTSDDEAREIREKGFVHKRRRTRSASMERGGTTGLEGDDDTATETDGGSRATARGKRQKKRVTTKQLKEEVQLPEVEIQQAALPEGFPSSELLTAIQTHTASLMSSRHSLLPALTPSAPFLPSPLQAHFTALSASIDAREAAAAREGRKDEYMALKQSRIRKIGAGARWGAWTDAERAFEGSALVAMGMLTQLLVQDVVLGGAPPPAPPALAEPAPASELQPAADAS